MQRSAISQQTDLSEDLKESLAWVKIDDVEDTLSYDDLKEFWNKIKDKVKNI